MKKLTINKARVHVEMDYYLSGSVLAGTVNSGVTEVRSEFDVSSDEAGGGHSQCHQACEAGLFC